MTDEIFRFVNVRPVQLLSSARIKRHFASYGQGKKSPFEQMVNALPDEDKRTKATELAEALLKSASDPNDTLSEMLDAVEIASAERKVNNAREVVEKLLDCPSQDFVDLSENQKKRDDIWDQLYAHAIAPSHSPTNRVDVVLAIQGFHYLEYLATLEANGISIERDELREVKPLIPNDLIPSQPVVKDETVENVGAEKADEAIKLESRIKEIDVAINELHLATIVLEDLSLRGELPKEGFIEVEMGEEEIVAATGDNSELTSFQMKIGKSWLTTELGEKLLSEDTHKIVKDFNITSIGLQSTEIIEKLLDKKFEMSRDFLGSLDKLSSVIVEKTNMLTTIKNAAPIPFSPGIGTPDYAPLAPVFEAGTPLKRGIRPLGIGDLLVVKQKLDRYTLGEVAHIENVMAKETKERIHSRMRELEETTVVETELIEENEKDLQSTERFELQTESQKTIESDMSVQAGVSVTGGWGPVSVTAYADFATSQSMSKSSRTASKYAKQITERSISRIMQRSREERTRRSLERFEEVNKHGFDNSSDKHVIGVYRWVDKYYKARLINYGRRLMLEFIIPEPAAYYRYLQANKTLDIGNVKKPKPPIINGGALKPSALNRNNYMDFVAAYNVQGVEPFPASSIRVGAALAEAPGQGGDKNNSTAKADITLVIPEGYHATNLYGIYNFGGYPGKYFTVFMAGESWVESTAYGLTGKVPISVYGNLTVYSVNVVAICELTSSAKQEWQLKTYQAIMNAYERALDEYNEAVAAAEIQSGVTIQGRNPGINRDIERDELKKSALRMLTDDFARTKVSGTWRFNERFNAMHNHPFSGEPEFNVSEAQVEGKIIQFFEQAFDWNNMTYRFYPYMWGRETNWDDVFPLTDTDPMFRDFLRAGAARVVLPAQEGYAEPVLHYMATNEIWEGDEPPTINDPLYISLADELRSDSDADINGSLDVCSIDSSFPCLVNEWEMKLPTELTYLQEDAKLFTERENLFDLTITGVIAQDSRLTVTLSDNLPPGDWELQYEGNAVSALSNVNGRQILNLELDTSPDWLNSQDLIFFISLFDHNSTKSVIFRGE